MKRLLILGLLTAMARGWSAKDDDRIWREYLEWFRKAAGPIPDARAAYRDRLLGAGLSEAAAAYGSSRQNVKAIATALEARGYLRLVADPSDRRAVRLAITPKVAVFSEAAWTAREAAVFEAVFDGLPPAEIRRTLEFIHRWLGVVAPALVVTGDPAPDLTTSQISRSTR